MRALLFLLILSSPIQAGWLLTPDVIDNYDGDTFKAKFEIWPRVTVETSVRVLGVDTPEIKGKCAEEKALALKAKTFTARALRSGRVVVSIIEPGVYKNRMLGYVYIDGVNLADLLIGAGLGRENNGEKRGSWCAE